MTNKIAVLSIVLMGVAIFAVNFAMADITIKNSNSFSGTQNVTANPTATATVSNVSATATGGTAIVKNSGNSTIVSGGCSDCDNGCSSSNCGTSHGTVSSNNGSGGAIIATGGTATANSGTTSASAQSNTSVSQSNDSDSTTKVTVDNDHKHYTTDKHGHRHYYRVDKNGHRYYYKTLPATGSNMIVLAGLAMISLLAVIFGVKKYSTKIK